MGFGKIGLQSDGFLILADRLGKLAFAFKGRAEVVARFWIARLEFDYLALLYASANFRRAWPAVLAGDPAMFCHLLRQANYYTADEGQYTRAVVSIFGDLRSLVPSAS